jgi:multiple sugar transport system permease protein
VTHPLRARRISLGRREAIQGYLYISPWLAGLVIFTAGPIVASAYMSLTEYRILVPPKFVGLDNYRQMLDALTNAKGAIKVFVEIAKE